MAESKETAEEMKKVVVTVKAIIPKLKTFLTVAKLRRSEEHLHIDDSSKKLHQSQGPVG